MCLFTRCLLDYDSRRSGCPHPLGGAKLRNNLGERCSPARTGASGPTQFVFNTESFSLLSACPRR